MGSKTTREQGAEERNLGSMEHRVCHKIMMFHIIEVFHLASLGILTQKIHQLYTSGLILIHGANSKISREQGDIKIYLRSTKNYFGEHLENNSGSREKRVKFQREPRAPLTESQQWRIQRSEQGRWTSRKFQNTKTPQFSGKYYR